jgi:predicted nucleic acid-binding protein
MTTVYDTGVLIAADRNDRRIWADHRARLEAGVVPVTTAPVVAQASRSPRQVPLRRFLRGCEIVGFEAAQAHAVGLLLAKSATSDIVDAHVAVTAARTGAVVITSDPDDRPRSTADNRPSNRLITRRFRCCYSTTSSRRCSLRGTPLSPSPLIRVGLPKNPSTLVMRPEVGSTVTTSIPSIRVRAPRNMSHR